MKRWNIVILQIVIAIIGLYIISIIAHQFVNDGTTRTLVDIVGLVIWFAYSVYNTRMRKKRLIKMWDLADQLGYGPEELKKFEPRYGKIDWEFSRPEKLEFYPSDRAVIKLIDQFNSELMRSN